MSAGSDKLSFEGSESESVSNISYIPPQKILHMIFVVKCSESIISSNDDGVDRIAAINRAFSSMLPALQNIQSSVEEYLTIYISILGFNGDAQWHVNPTPIMNYSHRNIIVSTGITSYSFVYEELMHVLSHQGFMNIRGKPMMPYIMFLTDRAPTHDEIFLPKLEKLRRYNGWFASARRYAVLIGKEAINNPMTRISVSPFVTDEHTDVIDAIDAQAIVESISTKTLNFLTDVTHRINTGEYEIGRWTKIMRSPDLIDRGNFDYNGNLSDKLENYWDLFQEGLVF